MIEVVISQMLVYALMALLQVTPATFVAIYVFNVSYSIKCVVRPKKPGGTHILTGKMIVQILDLFSE